MGVEEKGKSDMKSILKNALHWKQWMVDDFRILIELSEQDNVNKKALHSLIVHHLQTYQLVNQTYELILGDDKLFDLPNIEKLQKILPTLDLEKVSSEGIIEPMLELELDELSEELHEDALTVDFEDDDLNEDNVLDEDEDKYFEDDVDIEITVEDEESLEDEFFVDSMDDVDEGLYDDIDTFDNDESLDDPSGEQDQEDLTNSRADVSTSDIVGRLWGNLSSNALVVNEVNEGDVDVNEGRYE